MSCQFIILLLLSTSCTWIARSKLIEKTEKCTRSTDLTPTKTYRTPANKTISILDGVFDDLNLRVLKRYLMTTDSSDLVMTSANSNVWTMLHNAASVTMTNFGKRLMQAAQHLLPDDEKQDEEVEELVLRQMRTLIVRRGGGSVSLKSITDEHPLLTAALFLNDLWLKNRNGQLVFADDAAFHRTVLPRFGRFITWPGTGLQVMLTPPSIDETRDIFLVVFTFARRGNLDHSSLVYSPEDKHKPFDEWMETRVRRDENDAETNDQIDVEQHVVMRAENREGERLLVLDGLFSGAETSGVTSYVKTQGVMFYDNMVDGDSDNVNWIAALNSAEFKRTSLWFKILRVMKTFTGSFVFRHSLREANPETAVRIPSG